MKDLKTLTIAFTASLAATVAVALLVRFVIAKKTAFVDILSVPVGITAAYAVRMEWHMSNTLFPFVLAATVMLSAFGAEWLKMRRRAHSKPTQIH